ncbi:MAG: aldehyde dehydrogenase family protein [Kiritimatiellales bacterium]|nr:aldehyde dehydrogenase family protein [Kiritimatiellales bacterium]MCF7864180.1 aldehyde dehydrogenase family protein [Kiritimatiellales bacterium]
MLISLNPANHKVLCEYPEHSPAEVAEILNASDRAFRKWRSSDFGKRAALMSRVAGVLNSRSEEFAVLMAREMGKPIRQGRAEISKCAAVCDYYAQHAEAFLSDQPIKTEATKSFVAYQPLGVVLAVMPWRSPTTACSGWVPRYLPAMPPAANALPPVNWRPGTVS